MNLTPVEGLSVGASAVSFLDEVALGERAYDDDDPFSLDYADFDAELDAIAGELELELD